ncbi:MAG: hypothetical protein JO353_07330, partial [Phycisphaerae bacterium]|nr:hypothetical protein [Phycisphaerae bacterium]
NLRALNGTHSGTPSTYLYFQTPAATSTLPVPAVSSPGSSTSPGPVLTDATPTFQWTAVSGITGYQLNLYDKTSGQSFSYSIDPSATTFTPPSGTLTAGDSFVWNLRDVNGTQTGKPSTYLFFQLPATSAAGTALEQINTYSSKLVHLDSELHSLANQLSTTVKGTTEYSKLYHQYATISKEVKAIKSERSALEAET